MQSRAVSDPRQWNQFLLERRPNTFLQSWQWGELNRRHDEGVRYLGFFEEGQQIGAALLLTINARRGRFLFCPHGPLFRSDQEAQEQLPAFVMLCRDIARRDSAVALRISPLLEETNAAVSAFSSLGFRPAPLHMHTELTWMLDITPSEEDLLRGMRKTTRHAIRDAKEAGVSIEIVSTPTALKRFLPLYHQTKSRHNFIPFSSAFLEDQVLLFQQNNQMYIAIARYQNQDVAASIFIKFGPTVFYHHGASLSLLNRIPASQLLQWESIREAKRRGATSYNFWGIAPADQPDHPFAGITVFKKGFGGYAIRYLHAQDLPLSRMYWKLWSVDTYRRIKRGF